jgi:hypothetical protein
MRIPVVLTHYGEAGEGDVKRLTDRDGLYRLRVSKWREFFDLDTPNQFGFTASTIVGRRISHHGLELAIIAAVIRCEPLAGGRAWCVV